MEKLIKLLNESEKRRKSDLYYKFELENGVLYCYDDVTDVLWTMQDEAMVICSKQFGFIKWLVDNDKIDLLQLDNRIALSEFNKVERVLMALSISSSPIEDLISYLHE